MISSKHIVMTVNNEFTTDYRVHREAKALVDEGYRVTLLCVHRTGLARQENREGITVKRVLDAPIRLPFFPSSWRVRARWWRELLALHGDVYHAHDRDALDLSARAARKLGVPLIYDSHEYWPDKNRYEHNTGNLRDRLSEWWWHAKERRYVRWARQIIMTSPGHARGLVEHYGVQQPVLVRNIPEYQRGDSSERLRKKFGLTKSDRIVVYVGNIQRNRGIEEIIAALQHLSENVHFVAMGYGPYRTHLEQHIPGSLRDRVHFHDAIPYRDIVSTIHSADVGVAPFQSNCYSHRHVLPNKIFEYLMSELPVAVSNLPDMADIVRRYDVGSTFEADSPRDIARAINELLADQPRLSQLKRNALYATNTELRWDVEKKKLVALYRSILS
jgi:glycosyltransferase involved in cell wall biosynthesis